MSSIRMPTIPEDWVTRPLAAASGVKLCFSRSVRTFSLVFSLIPGFPFITLETVLAETDFKYFDFGISTEHNGRLLNEGLIYQKEGFGGRGICYDTYEYTLS